MAKKKIRVQDLEIRIEPIDNDDYISLTDIAKKSADIKPVYTIQNWIKNTNTIRFLYTWEKLRNPNIKDVHLHVLTDRASNNRFSMSPKKWVELTNAIGIYTRPVRGGGTFAHKDIALNFCYWLSPEFQVYMIMEFQRLKEEEADRKQLEWNIRKITDNVDEIRNILDTIEGQDPNRNRLNQSKE